MMSCYTAEIFYAPNAISQMSNHKIIAIAPPQISIAVRKNMDKRALNEQYRSESEKLQMEMYLYLKSQKARSEINTEILDVQTTNSLLSESGHPNNNILTPKEMCELLGVDAILFSNYDLEKPMSIGAAVALDLLVGVSGKTNTVAVTLKIHDNVASSILWKYSNEISGSYLSSANSLVTYLMKDVKKKMPYSKIN